MNKIKSFFKNIKDKTKKGAAAIYATLGTAALSTTSVFALPSGDMDADSMMTKIIGQILNIVRYIGIVLLVWGVIQLVMAFKNEDGDSKSRAAMMLGISIVLIGMKSLLNAIGMGL